MRPGGRVQNNMIILPSSDATYWYYCRLLSIKTNLYSISRWPDEIENQKSRCWLHPRNEQPLGGGAKGKPSPGLWGPYQIRKVSDVIFESLDSPVQSQKTRSGPEIHGGQIWTQEAPGDGMDSSDWSC